ncbi:glycosyltransferase [Rhizobium leguminosarum bv. viciae]|nr:glycosyltransferase [Rhizobium leguminosarum bv. viciae]
MRRYVVRILRDEKKRQALKAILSRSNLLTKISRRFLESYRQGRWSAIGGWASAFDVAILNDIVASDYFDVRYYQNSAGKVFGSAHAALSDYLQHGEKDNLRPSSLFDPLVYRYGHKDLADLKSSPLMHYFRHGRDEKRLTALDFDELSSAGKRAFVTGRPTVVLVSHEASMTGAPILACNISAQLAETCNVVSVILKGGVLVESFREHASLLLVTPEGTSGLDSRVLRERILRPVKERFGLDYVLANSVEAANVASAAQELGVPAVTLMHEFAEYVVPRTRVRDMVIGSQVVVFSSILTANSARKSAASNDFRNYIVLPQGKSEIPENEGVLVSTQLELLLEKQKSEKRFLVIGCGFVQIRKGVDLFISVAHRLAQKLGPKNTRFLWVGDGYYPDKDLLYCVWLRDQIARSGLEDVVTIIPGVDAKSLDKLYANADAMMMSSRLDPFPNVTIDAMQQGMPVVCFEGASGTAEFLQNIPQFKPLVAPYLDIDAAAGILARLATEPDFSRDIGDSLRAVSIEAFDMRRYVNRLIEILKDARSMTEQEKQDFEILKKADVLSEVSLGNALGKISSKDERVRKYLRFAASGIQGVDRIYRRPLLGFSPHIYLEHHPELNRPPFQNPLAHWIDTGRPEGPWFRQVLRFGQSGSPGLPPNDLKVGLHIHLHYFDILDNILERIKRNSVRPDLLISVTSQEGLSYVSSRLADYKRGKTIIKHVPNRGRDFGPMITEFGHMLADYDIVGHIHGKKSLEISEGGAVSPFGDVWREFLFENLVGGTTAAIDETLFAFAQDKNLGLIFPEDPNVVGWTENYLPAHELCVKLGVSGKLPASIEFPVGNMFYARPQALAPIFNSSLTWDDYPAEPVGYDGTILHAMERITPFVCEQQGFKWLTSEVEGFHR